MKKMILITNSFPYSPGEEFLETELKYLSTFNLTIMPINKKNECRLLDHAIYVENYLIENINRTNYYKNLMLPRIVFSKLFWKEIFINNILDIKRLRLCVSSHIQYIIYIKIFNTYFQNNKNLENTIIYTYWNNEATYALQTLKNKYGYKLISRIHGGDLYQERRPSKYMPLKKQFTKNIDKVYTITQSANIYLHNIYSFDHEVLELSRLGVDNYNIISLPSKRNMLHLVSCSFLVQVKQIDKIIEALQDISKNMPHIDYTWTHIGDGELHEKLLEMANNKLGNLENVHFTFLGSLDNQKVYQFYKNSNVDVFINVSESEGVPVSIMEAMSCHIPIIAPNIGGISDMVINNYNGFLLSSKSEVNEIVMVLKNVDFYKKKMIRENSYGVYLEKFNAEKNYKSFIRGVSSI